MRAPADLRGLPGAVSFLTVVPVRVRRADGFGLGPSLGWFPVVGAGIGAAGGAVRIGLQPLLGSGPSTVVALGVLVGLSGALHQDALADTADGLGVRGDRERRLAVMRDSTLGAFGVLALVLWGLCAFAALKALTPVHALLALVVAAAGGRATAVLHGCLVAPARPDGLGAALGASPARGWLALAVAAAIAVAAVGPWRGGLCAALTVCVAGVSAAGARRAFGGSTGDTLGATVAIGELAVVLSLLASWR